MKITVDDIKKLLPNPNTVKGDTSVWIDNVQTSENINLKSLDWVNPIKKNKIEYIKNSIAPIILCELGLEESIPELKHKCIIFVENPKLVFIRIVKAYFTDKTIYEIHQSTIVHAEATIDPEVYIGPNCYIGKCSIGRNTRIIGNCFVYDNTIIGENVIVHAGSVIGADGFGYQRNEKGEFEHFPHIGGVIIEDNVEIGSNTSIDRGALGNTIIRRGAKIDNLVHIAHNVVVGCHSAVIANAMIGGSTMIGDYTWVAPSVAVRDQLVIGANVTVGMGSVVTKNIPDKQTWTGTPAKSLDEFIILQNKLKKL